MLAFFASLGLAAVPYTSSIKGCPTQVFKPRSFDVVCSLFELTQLLDLAWNMRVPSFFHLHSD
jgi:hypothetical protein